MNQADYEKEHLTRLRKLACECSVLLRSNGDFPLPAPCKLALYGNGARHTLMGGTGSGEVNTRNFVSSEEGLISAGFTITTKRWLDRYDSVLNKAYESFKKYIKLRARAHHTLAMNEAMGEIMPQPNHSIPLDIKGDTAIYILSRTCGEGADRKAAPGDIFLNKTELRDIKKLNKEYDRFLLVLNVGGPVDLSELTEVDNILLLSQLGIETGHILTDLVLGKSYPSGKLATTWASYDDYPQIGEFGNESDTAYKEGVYVGYRYFDSVDKKALFPFGYGLGYTGFMVSFDAAQVDKGKVTVHALTKNIGTSPGKETLQLYVSVPAKTQDEPYQKLAAFAKTDEIHAGDTESVELSFDIRTLASYDEQKHCYYLDEGDYILRLGTNSVDTSVCAIVKLDKYTVVKQVKNSLTSPGFSDYIPPKKRVCDSADYVKILNISSDDIKTKKVSYDRHYTIEPMVKKLSDEELSLLNIGSFSRIPNYLSMVGNAGWHVAGAAGETTDRLTDIGIAPVIMADGPAGLRISRTYFTDKKGEHSLESGLPESVTEYMPPLMKKAIRLIQRKPGKSALTGTRYATAIPIGTAIAQSFNTELAYICGDIVGDEMERFGIDLWLAPALNIHRDIRCGRNFEYFSEDPLVSGEMAAAITKGVQSHEGKGVTIKHFAANNQEYNRTNNSSLVSERAMREIYLRGFEICIDKADPAALMTSYNLINGTHTSQSKGLINDILRCEFCYDGVVMTDWLFGREFKNKKLKYAPPTAPCIAAVGGDLCMPGDKIDLTHMKKGLISGTITRKQLEINASRVIRLAMKSHPIN